MPSDDVELTAVFSLQQQYPLMVTAVGGTVSINGVTQNTGDFFAGDSVVLEASPLAGYNFLTWLDFSGGTLNNQQSSSTSYTMPARAATVQAVFVLSDPVDLTVTATAGGYATGTGKHISGEKVAIHAIPFQYYHFVGWRITSGSGSIEVTSSTDTYFIMSSTSATVEAVFEQDPSYTLTLTGLNGTVIGGGTFFPGQTANIQAKASSGYTFVSWSTSDGGTLANSTSANTLYTMPSNNVTLTANFSPLDEYSLMVSYIGGSVDPTATFAYAGQQVTLTATPDPNWHFVGWIKPSNATLSSYTDPVTTLIMPAENVRLIAVFQQNPKYTVSLQATPAGGGIPSLMGVPTNQFYEGDTVTVSADAEPGYRFAYWDGPGVTFANPNSDFTTFKMPATNVVVTAVFSAVGPFDLMVTPSSGGYATSGSGQYMPGQTAEISATPMPYYHFAGWVDDNDEGRFDNPLAQTTQYYMPHSNAHVSALFEENPTYTVTIKSSSGNLLGAITRYHAGESFQLDYAIPPGETFVEWQSSQGGTFDNNKNLRCNFTMPANDVILVALLKTDPVPYTLLVKTSHGETIGSGTYFSGATVSISANPDLHYHFVGWTANHPATFVNPISSSTTITMPEDDLVVTAIMVEDQKFHLTVSGDGGTETGSGLYYAGDLVPIKATPDSTHVFIKWIAADGVLTNPLRSSTTYQMAAENTTVMAVFGPRVAYNLEVINSYGTASGSGSYYAGKTVSVSTSVSNGMVFSHWIVTMSDKSVAVPSIIGENPSFVMPASGLTLEAVYVTPPEPVPSAPTRTNPGGQTQPPVNPPVVTPPPSPPTPTPPPNPGTPGGNQPAPVPTPPTTPSIPTLSIFDLILTVAVISMSITGFFATSKKQKAKRNTTVYKLILLVVAISIVALFFLTQTLTGSSYVWLDRFSIIFLAITVLQAVGFMLFIKSRNK